VKVEEVKRNLRTCMEAPNPVCTEDEELPPPPSVDPDNDPAMPHPDEPGVGAILLSELAEAAGGRGA
jgi:hypothetical protein